MIAGKRKGNSELWWAAHNLVAHPLSEVFYWLKLKKLSCWIHDETIPIHDTESSGRG